MCKIEKHSLIYISIATLQYLKYFYNNIKYSEHCHFSVLSHPVCLYTLKVNVCKHEECMQMYMSLTFLKTCLARLQNEAKEAFCSSASSMSWGSGFLTLFIRRTSFSITFLLSSTWPTHTSLSYCHWHSLPHSIPFGETKNSQFQAFNRKIMITEMTVLSRSCWKCGSRCPGLFSVAVGLWLAQPWQETVLESKQHPQHWNMQARFFTVVCEQQHQKLKKKKKKKFKLKVRRNLCPTEVAYPWGKGQGGLAVYESGWSNILTVQSPEQPGLTLWLSLLWDCRPPCQPEFSCNPLAKQNIILAAANW